MGICSAVGCTTALQSLSSLAMQRHRHQEFAGFLNAVKREVPVGKMCSPFSTVPPPTSFKPCELDGAPCALYVPFHPDFGFLGSTPSRASRRHREPPRVCRRPFRLKSRRGGGLVRHGIVAFLGFGWRDVADGLQQRRLLNRSTHSSVANATASNDRHGGRRWMASAL